MSQSTEKAQKPESRPCYLCGKNPAEGFASVWTRDGGERRFCHGDEQELSCYEAQSIDPTDLAWATRTIFDLRTPPGSEGQS